MRRIFCHRQYHRNNSVTWFLNFSVLIFVMVLLHVSSPMSHSAEPGDINNDGEIKLDDALVSLQVSSGNQAFAVELSADVNGDGKIGIAEALFVLNTVSGGGGCTPLQGTITTISKDTYCVQGDVIVAEGTRLIIPAGTTFIFQGKYHFGRDPSLPDAVTSRSGTIWAIGTEEEPIIFRGKTPEIAWWGIIVSNQNDKVHFEHVTIRDAVKDDTNPNSRIWRRGGGLNSYNNKADTIIRHCKFINNRARSIGGALAINGNGYWPNAKKIEITNTLFDNNSCDCATYSGSTDDVCGGGAIRVSHVVGNEELVKIRNNDFRDNSAKKTTGIDAYGGAIGGFSSSIIIGPGNAFISNSAHTLDGAISCAGHNETGLVIRSVDPSVTFTGNTPNNGCGL